MAVTVTTPPTVTIATPGPQGPTGPAGATGPAGPAGPQPPLGAAGAGDTIALKSTDPTTTNPRPPTGTTTVTGTAAVGLALAASGTSAGAWVGADFGDWVFNVRAYGAKGDGRLVTDGAITAGQTALTSATLALTAADQGKLVMVKGAGPTGVTTLVTTIQAVNSGTSATLAAAASTTVTGALVMVASDDTAPIQQAIDDAVTYAQAHCGVARVYIPAAPGFYGIGGPLVTGGTTKGNAQLTLPVIGTTGTKVVLTIEGVTNGSGLQHWQQTMPQTGGSTLVSFGVFASTTAQSNSITANGNPCVIGGPAQPGGYGVSPGVFSNMIVTVRNLAILTTYSLYGLTYSAGDLSGVANASLENVAYGTTGIVPNNDFVSPNQFANGLSVGWLMPAAGNNDNCTVRNVSVHGGYTYAFFATEHCVIDTMRLLYCWSALCPVGTYFGSVGATHAIKALQLSIEGCTNVVYIIGAGSNGTGPIVDIDQLDTEASAPAFSGNSATAVASALGTVKLTGLFTPSGVTVTNPTGLRIINGQVARPVKRVTATYAVSVIDESILVDATAGPVTITLISADYTPNQYTITKTDSSTNAVTVAAASGQTINGTATQTLTTQYASLTVYSAYNGTAYAWYQH